MKKARRADEAQLVRDKKSGEGKLKHYFKFAERKEKSAKNLHDFSKFLHSYLGSILLPPKRDFG